MTWASITRSLRPAVREHLPHAIDIALAAREALDETAICGNDIRLTGDSRQRWRGLARATRTPDRLIEALETEGDRLRRALAPTPRPSGGALATVAVPMFGPVEPSAPPPGES